MPSIHYSLAEMNLAIKSLQDLIDIEDGHDSSHIWGTFVHHLELVWKKTEKGMGDVRNQFQPFQGRFANKRKNDSLLSYLFQSRHFHEHEATELVAVQITSPNIVLDQHAITKDVDDKGQSIPGTERFSHYYLSHLKLKTFFINNRTWVVPADHNGSLLKDVGNPYEVGFHGCSFYLDFLYHTDMKFLDGFNRRRLLDMMSSDTLRIAKHSKGPDYFNTELIPVKGGQKIRTEIKLGTLR